MTGNNWSEQNRRYLVAALAQVRQALEQYMARARGEAVQARAEETQPAYDDSLPPPALLRLCAAFGLTSFERDILLLCAGMDLDAAFPTLCAPAPTFGLALAALPAAHWDALAPASPLRRWRLISMGSSNALTQSPLRIDERIIHCLLGISQPDERLAASIMELPAPTDEPVPSQQELIQRLVAAWSPLLAEIEPLSLPERETTPPVPVLQLCGEDTAGKFEVARGVCAALDLGLSVLPAAAVPLAPGEIESFCRQLVRPVLTFDARKPTTAEQRQLWQNALGKLSAHLNGHIGTLVAQFNLSASAIRAASTPILQTTLEDRDHDSLGTLLWDTCRVQARPALEDLAQRIEPVADWHDLVLPEPQLQLLHEIAAHVRQRSTVYETWGFSAGSTRGLGISALFAGASGTGKTLAAEVLAHELRLDLYRIDLSSVVSKYIGETEKNLRRVFDAAEEGGAILLFDEADALFGKRSEVKDSHDRYANIEVSYLLQRMEAYRGLAILTTNLKSALDTAFLRRIRFIVHFPFPDAAQRAEIWRRILPPRMPVEGLDVQKLARLNVAGGNIRNIALNAAFLAADAHEPVRMAHMLRAASAEYAKLEKHLSEVEIGGWL